jgi:hypothetical protein
MLSVGNGDFREAMMKIDRHGQAKILTHEEIQLLFGRGLHQSRRG